MNRVKHYLELIRFPNLFTAMADIAAGVFIVNHGWDSTISYPFLLLLLSSSCLYAMGTVLNDYFDFNEDLIERPNRPLPSGRIQRRTALTLGIILGVAGVLLAGFAAPLSGVISLVLAGCILLYDRVTKKSETLGPLTMGLCRSFNLLLGMSLIQGQLVEYWWIASFPLIYIFSVTSLSRGETGTKQHPYRVGIAASGYLVCFVLILLFIDFSEHLAAGMIALSLFFFWSLYGLWPAVKQSTPAMIQRAVGKGVIGIVLLDAAIATPFGGIVALVSIVAFLVLSQFFARSFSVT